MNLSKGFVPSQESLCKIDELSTFVRAFFYKLAKFVMNGYCRLNNYYEIFTELKYARNKFRKCCLWCGHASCTLKIKLFMIEIYAFSALVILERINVGL